MVGLIFSLGEDYYSLDVKQVVEIVPAVPCRPLPGSPSYIAGLMTYRGETIPVLDFNLLNNSESKRHLFSSRIIVVDMPLTQGGVAQLGIMVESVFDTVKVDDNKILPNPVTLYGKEFLAQCFEHLDRLVIHLEINQLLSDEVKNQLYRKKENGDG